MFFVYIIKSQKDGRLYKGLTKDILNRLREHNNGKQKSAKAYRPWELIYSESFNSRADARKREKFFKSGTGCEYLKKFLDL